MVYVPGDFYRQCDVCGFRYRASQTYKRWDNLIVCAEDYEDQHPQDFVRGRKDRQSVPDPRPEPTVMTLVGPLTTNLAAAANAGATSITVESSTRFVSNDNIGIILADGSMRKFVVNTVPDSTTITLTSGLPESASSGALVTNYTAVAEVDIG